VCGGGNGGGGPLTRAPPTNVYYGATVTTNIVAYAQKGSLPFYAKTKNAVVRTFRESNKRRCVFLRERAKHHSLNDVAAGRFCFFHNCVLLEKYTYNETINNACRIVFVEINWYRMYTLVCTCTWDTVQCIRNACTRSPLAWLTLALQSIVLKVINDRYISDKFIIVSRGLCDIIANVCKILPSLKCWKTGNDHYANDYTISVRMFIRFQAFLLHASAAIGIRRNLFSIFPNFYPQIRIFAYFVVETFDVFRIKSPPTRFLLARLNIIQHKMRLTWQFLFLNA